MHISLGHTTNGVKVFSISKTGGVNAAMHKFFDVATRNSFTGLVAAAAENSWSPIVWKNGERRKANFKSCGIVALDIDQDFTVDDAAQWLKTLGYEAAILLSKSHQKPKGDSPPCDRFRVLINANEINSLEQYEANMKFWMGLLPMADKACKDGARFFFQSPRVAYMQSGKPYEWQDFTALIEREKMAQQRRRAAAQEKFKGTGAIPEKLLAIIARGAPEGERHKLCYWLGCVLADLGIGHDDSVRMILAGGLGSLGEQEVVRTVRDARRRAQ